jgi:hypothetical protein
MAKKWHEASFDPENVRRAREVGHAHEASTKISNDHVAELLRDVFDVHTHSGPDTAITRFYDDWQNARQFMEWGMAGFAAKAHGGDTSRSAAIVQKFADDYAEAHGLKKIRILGGVCLNYAVGGWNPEAVKSAATFGGKFVWTPTLDAAHDRKVVGREGGLEVLDGNEHLLPEVEAVLRTIAERDLVLSISHQSTEERFVLVQEATKLGIARLIVDHPHQANTKMTLDQMEEFALAGANLGIYSHVDPKEAVAILERIPHERLLFGSDKGFILGPTPAEGLREFIARLLLMGVAQETIRRVFVENPHKLVFGDKRDLR